MKNMGEKEFELIEPLEVRPVLPKNERVSRVEKLILEFANSDYKYAAVRDELVDEYENIKGCARALGRIVSKLKKRGMIAEEIKVYSSMDRIYLEE